MPESYITITASNNCNFNYISGLATHWEIDKTMISALKDLLTSTPRIVYSPYGKTSTAKSPVYRHVTGGMYLFAQGSEHNIDKMPYANVFKTLIEEHKLGKVIECDPVPNALHGGKPGILFVWILDKNKMHKWWKINVEKPYIALQKTEVKAEIKSDIKADVKQEVLPIEDDYQDDYDEDCEDDYDYEHDPEGD